jgi:hypothetical protein
MLDIVHCISCIQLHSYNALRAAYANVGMRKWKTNSTHLQLLELVPITGTTGLWKLGPLLSSYTWWWKHIQLPKCHIIEVYLKQEMNSFVRVRERTIPTERPPRVGEVSANFLQIKGATWSVWRIPRPYSRLSRPEPLLFLSSSSSLVLTSLSAPCSRPSTARKICRESSPDLWICSEEPLDHRGGQVYLKRWKKSNFIKMSSSFVIFDNVSGGRRV